jgi:NAD(P)-dependent dehydrogenase (short-subunit alcohol dehydrogenase family)
MAEHPALRRGNVAVVTGGASGIGLAAAKRFAAFGLKVCVADLDGVRLEAAAAAVAALAADGRDAVLAVTTDVSKRSDIQQLETTVRDRFGNVDVLMANAGIQTGSQIFGPPDNWQQIIDVNLWGIIHTAQVFVPAMIRSGRPSVVIHTGSKQGITTPPGDPAYNISKAGVKVFTEALQHELRNIPGCLITAHLLIPGFVFTPLTAKGRIEQPAGAWTPEQTIRFMLDRLVDGDFYILCPDNDVPRALDERRIAWAAGDIIENRPPLSRWHPDFAECFQTLYGRAVHLR